MIINILKITVAAGLIYWMISKGILDLNVLSEIAKGPAIVLCFVMVFAHIFLANLRWSLLLAARGMPIGIFKSLRLTMIGIFFNIAMPGGVGGDVVKGYYLIKDFPNKKMDGATTILMDRVFGLYSMVLISIFSFAWNWKLFAGNPLLIKLGFGIVAFFFALTGFFIFALSRRVNNSRRILNFVSKLPMGAFIQKVREAFHSYTDNRKLMVLSVGISTLSQSLVVLLAWYVASVTTTDSWPLSTFFGVIPLGIISTVLPVAPAGIGVGQAAVFFIFKIFTGVESSVGPNVITAYQVIYFCFGIPGALFFLKQRGKIREFKPTPSASAS